MSKHTKFELMETCIPANQKPKNEEKTREMKINWGIKIRRALFCENKDYKDSSGEDKLYIDGKKY